MTTIWTNTATPTYIHCNVYVDAAYVREDLKSVGYTGEFNPLRLAALISSQRLGHQMFLPVRFFYYDAVDANASPEDQARQQAYLNRIEELPDTAVRTGYVRQGRRQRREQKAVDVQLAVDALEAARSGTLGAITIVSGDADFAPLAEAIQRAGPHVLVLAFKDSLSAFLRDAADRVIYIPNWQPQDWLLPT